MRKENSRFPRFLQEDTQWCWSLIKPYGLGLLTYPRRLTWSTRVARGLISGLTRLKRKNLTCYHVQMLLRQTRPRSGCATSIGQSCPTGLPIVVEFTTVAAATDSDDRIGTTNGPEHSGAFEPGGDESFTGRFDHS